jgi:hypothetical protein
MNDQLLLFINGFAGRSSVLDTLMIFIAKDLVYLVFLTAFICMGLYIYKKEWKPVIYFFATLVVSYVLLQLMTLLNVDHRPFMDHHLTQRIAFSRRCSYWYCAYFCRCSLPGRYTWRVIHRFGRRNDSIRGHTASE